MMQKIKLFGAIGLLALIGIVAAFAFFTGSGAVTVVAPEASSVKVQIDGKVVAEIAAAGHQQLHLDQGKHQVSLIEAGGRTTTHQIDVTNGGYNQLLPTSSQCFADFDVTNYAYESKSLRDKLKAAMELPIQVVARYADHKPFDLPNAYFAMEDLPQKLKSGARVAVLRELPCQAFAKPDKELVKIADL